MLLLCSMSTAEASYFLQNPKVDYKSEPNDVDPLQNPLFSWQAFSDKNGSFQKNYRIKVYKQDGSVVWDSGITESDRSLGIEYSGMTLEPETEYVWEVEVEDNHGEKGRCKSTFETTLSDWKGARWIGGDETSLPFYSQYFPVFRLSFDIKLSKNCKGGGIIYGGNDLRLLDRRKNIYGVEAKRNESYYEVRFSADSLRVYRKGYKRGEEGGKEVASFAMPEGYDPYMTHSVVIDSNAGITSFMIDSIHLGTRNISPTPGGGDYTAFPIVGDVGYFTDGGDMTVDNFRVENYRSPHNILARADIGKVGGRKIFSLDDTGMTTIRRRFDIGDKKVRKARLYATSRGVYDFHINGERIGDRSLNPGSSQYNKSHFFQTFDVTPYIKSGVNDALVQLNEGWWSGGASFDPANWNWFGDRQSLLSVLKLCYDDGSEEIIVSEPEKWEFTSDGPVRYGSLFQGEVFDARREDYSSAIWKPAKEVELQGSMTDKPNGDWQLANDYSSFKLLPDNDSGVGVYETLGAKDVVESTEGAYVYDFGQNCSGVPSVTFRNLKKGQVVTLRYAEVFYPDLERYGENRGNPMVENLRAAMSQDIYFAKGEGIEVFEPRSTYHGYRFVEITGLEEPVALADVKNRVLSSVDCFTSKFSCSDPLVNRLNSNIRYSTLSNVFSIPTDCPQRNERMGWSGDVSVFAPAMTYLFNARNFLSRHTLAIRDCIEPTGAFPPIAPMGGGFGGPLWQSAGIVIPWQLYRQYGDIRTLKDNYPAMKKYIEMVLTDYIDPSDGHFRGTETWSDLGDWLGPQCNQNDKTLIFDSYLVYELDIMNKVAQKLGLEDDADYYSEESRKRRAFINENYVDRKGETLVGKGFGPDGDSWTGPLGGKPEGMILEAQTSYAVPLALNVFTPSNEKMMSGKLHDLVSVPARGDDNKIYPEYSLMTGFIGTPWILHSLADNGYEGDAYRILSGKSYPSWLYPVGLGATSVWERLNSMTEEEGFGNNNSMNSFNHYAFGCVYDWLMQKSAGIMADEENPGFKHFYLSPTVDPTGWLKYVEAEYDSPYGRIESRWRIDEADGTVAYEFVIPANTTATLILPDGRRELCSGNHKIKVNMF